jgi:MFS family permease
MWMKELAKEITEQLKLLLAGNCCKINAKADTSMWKSPVTFNKWLVLVAGSVVMLASGLVYAFAAVASVVKTEMDYTQYEINFIGTLSGVGSALGVLPGLVHDNYGPRWTSLLSGILMSSGYFLMYLSTSRMIFSTYWLMGMYLAMFSAGCAGCFSSGLATNIKNFDPKHRGKVVGFLQCVFGLASALFSAMFKFVFQGKLLPFMLMTSIFSLTGPLFFGCIFLNVIEEPAQPLDTLSIQDDPVATDVTHLIEKKTVTKPVETVEEIVTRSATPLQLLTSIDFYLMGIIFFCGAGSGGTAMINIGSMLQSYGGSDNMAPVLIIIYSISSSGGRLLIGYLSDRFSHVATRSTFLNITQLVLGFTCLGFAFASVPMFYVLMASIGCFYGGLNAMIAAVLSERFGTKYFAINSGFTVAASTLGSYVLATILAASVYQSHITHQGGKRCYGRDCYQLTFVICCIVCSLGFVAGLVLMHRTRPMYEQRNLYYSKN